MGRLGERPGEILFESTLLIVQSGKLRLGESKGHIASG